MNHKTFLDKECVLADFGLCAKKKEERNILFAPAFCVNNFNIKIYLFNLFDLIYTCKTNAYGFTQMNLDYQIQIIIDFLICNQAEIDCNTY